ncbi:hypothetical protein [Brochothrix campestris]|uniref:Uncharacterized protein n=1 Tax=Brochothrix campestris FSL F6-1037 TaxID=1265861 RepID=W7CDF1_9LIST|nr:hypothetical protein [Brochothrix campestris]EUJ37359.1 hypothetical protein BCAMP_10020 [Brochothrix campestris FSL F6-1037]
MRNRTKWILGTLIIVLGVSVYFNYFTPTKESYIEDQPLTEKFKTKMALATGYHYQLKPTDKKKANQVAVKMSYYEAGRYIGESDVQYLPIKKAGKFTLSVVTDNQIIYPMMSDGKTKVEWSKITHDQPIASATGMTLLAEKKTPLSFSDYQPIAFYGEAFKTNLTATTADKDAIEQATAANNKQLAAFDYLYVFSVKLVAK